MRRQKGAQSELHIPSGRAIVKKMLAPDSRRRRTATSLPRDVPLLTLTVTIRKIDVLRLAPAFAQSQKTMSLFGIVLLAQLAGPAGQTLPVLEFPERGLDDSASYAGYQTRFFRDASANTVQVYLDHRIGRVVNVWADAENESIGFTARDSRGGAAGLSWASPGATVTNAGRSRSVEYDLVADQPRIALGWFLLGSMRVERDFQYRKYHLAPYAARRNALGEFEQLVAAVARLPQRERGRHLALLGAGNVQELRARLRPTVTTARATGRWSGRITQPSLDGRDTIAIELRADPSRVIAMRAGDSITFRARSGRRVQFTVRITTTGKALTPLARDEIFSAEFLRFLAASRGAPAGGTGGSDEATVRGRRLERQVRGVELLSSREKLMAGLPTYATYFGRDMMMTALMMRPIWRDEMSEFVIASVLRKLGPAGDVSHEEALGGQAVRESAVEYAALVSGALRAGTAAQGAAADSLFERARTVLRDMRVTRENYHMIDDEFQLPVLAARWLADPKVANERKRAFLLDRSDYGESRLARLVREMGLVARMTAAYAAHPDASNLISFARRDSTWGSASWRDSGAGYAGGRYAMDINAIWAPHGLSAIAQILDELRTLGISTDSLAATMPDLAAGAPLGNYARSRPLLDSAIATWRGAEQHFVVRLTPAEVRSRVAARLAAMPAADRSYWAARVAPTKGDAGSLEFLAIALDANGHPIAVANTDAATRLFLGAVPMTSRAGATGAAGTDAEMGDLLRDVRLFVSPYPVGLLVKEVGPVVANDAYAPPSVWETFVRDPYHGPRVVWGREVNLFLLGVANTLAAAAGDASLPNVAPTGAPAVAPSPAEVAELRAAVEQVRAAAEASGFHSELWSYDVVGGRVVPARYGTSGDVQLWSTTDLVVQFALSRLQR